MTLRKMRNLLLFAAMGAIPLATVASCDFGDGYGSFVFDRGDSGLYPGFGLGDGGIVVYEEEYIEEEFYYEEEYYEEYAESDGCSPWDGCYWDDLW